MKRRTWMMAAAVVLLCMGLAGLASMPPAASGLRPVPEGAINQPAFDRAVTASIWAGAWATDNADGCRVCCGKHRDLGQGWNDRFVSKIDPEVAAEHTCTPPASLKDERVEQFPPLVRFCQRDLSASSAENRAEKRVSVSGLVQRALQDQSVLLRAKRAALQRWSPRDQSAFFKWFGTANENARAQIQRRIAILMEINEQYSVRNFRRAMPPRLGVFAYVHAVDPTRIFLDREFVKARPTGENSRAGTITHEMSHFLIAGGTKDHVYGTAKCKALARSSTVLALTNADNFEFYVENAP